MAMSECPIQSVLLYCSTPTEKTVTLSARTLRSTQAWSAAWPRRDVRCSAPFLRTHMTQPLRSRAVCEVRDTRGRDTEHSGRTCLMCRVWLLQSSSVQHPDGQSAGLCWWLWHRSTCMCVSCRLVALWCVGGVKERQLTEPPVLCLSRGCRGGLGLAPPWSGMQSSMVSGGMCSTHWCVMG